MTNLFLKVNKDLFKLGLNPTEILLLAQIIEFTITTGDCYKTNEAFAADLGISASTVNRALNSLEEKGYINRDSHNIRGGKERHMTAHFENIDAKLTTVKMKVDSCQQDSNCTLTNVNLTVDNKQNESIKDNSEDKKEKDKFMF